MSKKNKAPGAAASAPESHYRTLFDAAPSLYVVLEPQSHIAAVNDANACAIMTRREDIAGNHLFEIFPDNPDALAIKRGRNLRASFMRVLQSAKADAIPLNKCGRQKSTGGGFEAPHRSLLNTPVLGVDKRPVTSSVDHGH